MRCLRQIIHVKLQDHIPDTEVLQLSNSKSIGSMGPFLNDVSFFKANFYPPPNDNFYITKTHFFRPPPPNMKADVIKERSLTVEINEIVVFVGKWSTGGNVSKVSVIL